MSDMSLAPLVRQKNAEIASLRAELAQVKAERDDWKAKAYESGTLYAESNRRAEKAEAIIRDRISEVNADAYVKTLREELEAVRKELADVSEENRLVSEQRDSMAEKLDVMTDVKTEYQSRALKAEAELEAAKSDANVLQEKLWREEGRREVAEKSLKIEHEAALVEAREADALRKELAQVKASAKQWRESCENNAVKLTRAESEVAALKRCYACAKDTNGPRSQCFDCWKAIELRANRAESELSALKEREGKIVETRDHYEKELADAKARRDKRVYELTEVAYLASLRPLLALLLPAQAKGEECEHKFLPCYPGGDWHQCTPCGLTKEIPPAPEKPSVTQQPSKSGEMLGKPSGEGKAEDWLCTVEGCGKRPFEGHMAEWRWNGSDWEHYHGYPAGHFAAERKPPAPKECGEVSDNTNPAEIRTEECGECSPRIHEFYNGKCRDCGLLVSDIKPAPSFSKECGDCQGSGYVLHRGPDEGSACPCSKAKTEEGK